MDDTLVREIEVVRARLASVQREREGLSDDALRARELLDEEHRLVTRLADLADRAESQEHDVAEEEAAAQTDLTRTPDLPTKADEHDSHDS